MAQAYGELFARLYDKLYTGFAQEVAPAIRRFYLEQTGVAHNPRVLDLACGTGQLALDFLANGFRVTGVDLSLPMLTLARSNAAAYVSAGIASFLQADAARFTLDNTYDLVVSTFDALNHLRDSEALEGCFSSVAAATRPGSLFVFDLNTRRGIRRWNGITVTETDNEFILQRGIYDGGARAEMMISGFVRQPGSDHYARFEEHVYNTVFELATVRELLLGTGWSRMHFARLDSLGTAVEDPEQESRIFVVAVR
ncbi:MAG TPA: class I SAM-dependent methyltransferase [Propionibacteriaceae bacterium]|nr:class I SAM-dependent methyltransferase [Propionibacteriaceae bacterium]